MASGDKQIKQAVSIPVEGNGSKTQIVKTRGGNLCTTALVGELQVAQVAI